MATMEQRNIEAHICGTLALAREKSGHDMRYYLKLVSKLVAVLALHPDLGEEWGDRFTAMCDEAEQFIVRLEEGDYE